MLSELLHELARSAHATIVPGGEAAARLWQDAPILEETAQPASPLAYARAGTLGAEALRSLPWPILLITLTAALLRFVSLEGVSPNLFYDAAVRSMSLSWHNFFFGAFDPGALLSLDKPPLDLWLQVISVKVLGWNQFALKLPEALAGTIAVPLLYDAVRRAVGRPAALAAAAALTFLPESVLTARSDTMDSVMMLLVIAALWLTIRACTSGRRRTLLLAGVALGLAFNVKLLEALIAAPGLAVLYLLAASAPVRRKLVDLALAGVALVAVGLAWAMAASLAPGRHPWPVGSSDGTIWNAMFVFNGFGKVGGAAVATKPGGPGLFRLLVPTGWHYDLLFGCVLLAAVALGVAAATHALRAARRSAASPAPVASAPVASAPAATGPATALPRAFAIALAVWIAFAVIVFDTMVTVHARYLEALAPALAAAIGYAAASLAGLGDWQGRAGRPSLVATLVALLCICAYTFKFEPASTAWGALALMVAAGGAALIARARGPLERTGKWLLATLIVAAALVFPAHEALTLVRTNANDSLGLATVPTANTAALERFLVSRTTGLRYELAVDEPLALAALVIHDRRPILPLTSFGGIPLTGVDRLRREVRLGAVRYALVGGYRCAAATARAAACGPAARWIRTRGLDVTASVGLVGSARLYLLSPGRAG